MFSVPAIHTRTVRALASLHKCTITIIILINTYLCLSSYRLKALELKVNDRAVRHVLRANYHSDDYL